jgi:hypothetical protein
MLNLHEADMLIVRMKQQKGGIMLNRIYVILMVAVVGVFACLPAALAHDPGTTSCNYLKMGVGARAVGLGEAYTAVGDDAEAACWNPGGLGLLEGGSVKMMHNQWFEGISLDYFGIAYNLGRFGVLGFSGKYLWMDKMQVTTIAEPEGTGEEFGAYDAAGTISYAKKLNSALSAGVNIKALQEGIDTEKGMAYALDIGAICSVNKQLRVGASVNNIGSKMKLVDEGYRLPLEYRAGAAYWLFSSKSVMLAADVTGGIDENINGHFGCEAKLLDIISLRVGYKTETIKDIDYLSGLSGGIGFALSGVELDYVWVPYGDLGQTHRIGIGYKFGGTGSTKIAKNNAKDELAAKHYKQGIAYYKNGDHEKSKTEWKQALALNPDNAEVKKLLNAVENNQKVTIRSRKNISDMHK